MTTAHLLRPAAGVPARTRAAGWTGRAGRNDLAGRLGRGLTRRMIGIAVAAATVAALGVGAGAAPAVADPGGSITVVPAGVGAGTDGLVGVLDGGLVWRTWSGSTAGLTLGPVAYQAMDGAVTALSAGVGALTCGNLVVDAADGGAVWQDVSTGESGFAGVGGNTGRAMSLLAATHDGWLATDDSTHLVFAVNARTGATTTPALPFPTERLGQHALLCSRTHEFLVIGQTLWQIERSTGTVTQLFSDSYRIQLYSALDGSVVYSLAQGSHLELRRQDPGKPVTVLRSDDTSQGPFVDAALSATDTYIIWTGPTGLCGPILRQPVGGGAAVPVPGTSACGGDLVTNSAGPLLIGSSVAALLPGGVQTRLALPTSVVGGQPRQSPGRLSWIVGFDRADTRDVHGATLGPISTALTGVSYAVAASGRRTVAHRNGYNDWIMSSSGAPADYAARAPLPTYLDAGVPVAMVGHRAAFRRDWRSGLWVVDLAAGTGQWVDDAVGLAEIGPLVLDPAGTVVTTPAAFAPLVTKAEAGIPAGGRFLDLAADGDVVAWRWADAQAGQMGFGWKNVTTKVVHPVALPAHVAVTAVSVYGNDVMATVRGQSPALRVLDVNSEASVMADPSFDGWDPTIGPDGLTWVAPTGEVKLAPLPDQHRPPHNQGNPIQPRTIFVGDHAWAAEWVFDQPLTSCSVAVRSPQGALVRTVACDPAQMARGEAVATWDGLDAAGQPVPAGDNYSYTLSAGDADGTTSTGANSVRVLSLDDFVVAAYEDFLGRTPSSAEVAFQANAILTGAVTREGFLRALALSTEWLSAIVTGMYEDTLGRAPDAAGLATWVGWLQARRFTVAQVAALFYSSDEFFAGLGGGTASSWVTTLYHDLLGREPDAAGLAQWVVWTNDPARGRAWVATQFYGSLESRMVRVQGLYQALLGRDPDPVGWPFWADAIQRMDDVELAVSLAASPEYYLRAQG